MITVQQLTKKALGESLKKLLSLKTLDNITVIDVVEDCGVNRQTFYYHFQDIYALLEWVFEVEAENAIQNKITYADWTKCMDEMFEYILSNKSFITNIYRSVGRELLEKYLFEVESHYIRFVIDDFDKDNRIPEDDKIFLSKFISYALVNLYLEWIKDNMKSDYKILINKTEKLLAGDFAKFLI